jgi:uncharacterized membrane protein
MARGGGRIGNIEATVPRALVAMTETGNAADRSAAHAGRLGMLAYAALALGLVLYIVAIWAQVYIDTRKVRIVAPNPYFESHRHWRMRTALVFLIWSVLGGLTLPFGFGWLILIPAYAWYLYRVAKGIAYFRLGWTIGATGVLAGTCSYE